jgi:O-antigen ligase/polysaccharide polymerase Wzy-like membrane protein
MPDEALLVARVLFWMFAAGVVLLPMRWSLFCFILAAHMDITSLTFNSATAIGFENTVRIGGLPLLLLLRTGFAPLKDITWTLPQKIWLGLVVYAAIAGAWSGFPLAAVKMVAYLVTYFLLFLIFCSAWSEGRIDVGLLRLVAWSVIALAVLQTFVLGDEWGGLEERFTSFSTPQYFAAFLVAVLAILIFSGEKGWFHYATCGGLMLTIVFSGSRYVFVSMVALVIIACFRVVSGKHESPKWRPNLRKMLVTLAVAAAGIAILVSYLPYNRIDELVWAASDDDSTVEDVGTFAWRLGIYEDILEHLEKRTGPELFFGSGTSSGAALMLNHDPDHYDREGIDANRVLHSEFLRALYEWGILGLGLLLAFVIATTAGFVKKIAAEGGGAALAFAGALPSIVMGLAIENILAGAASAGGVGILLAMTFAWKGEPAASHDVVFDDEFETDGATALSA